MPQVDGAVGCWLVLGIHQIFYSSLGGSGFLPFIQLKGKSTQLLSPIWGEFYHSDFRFFFFCKGSKVKWSNISHPWKQNHIIFPTTPKKRGLKNRLAVSFRGFLWHLPTLNSLSPLPPVRKPSQKGIHRSSLSPMLQVGSLLVSRRVVYYQCWGRLRSSLKLLHFAKSLWSFAVVIAITWWRKWEWSWSWS